MNIFGSFLTLFVLLKMYVRLISRIPHQSKVRRWFRGGVRTPNNYTECSSLHSIKFTVKSKRSDSDMLN